MRGGGERKLVYLHPLSRQRKRMANKRWVYEVAPLIASFITTVVVLL